MDDETREALSRLRDRVAETNDNLNTTTDAVGALIEEIGGVKRDVEKNGEKADLILKELQFFRLNLQQQINHLRNQHDSE